jgi:hypothetical protein
MTWVAASETSHDGTDPGPRTAGEELRTHLRTLDERAAGLRNASAISPVDVVHLLLGRVGLTRWDLVGMTREEAVARPNEYRSTGR